MSVGLGPSAVSRGAARKSPPPYPADILTNFQAFSEIKKDCSGWIVLYHLISLGASRLVIVAVNTIKKHIGWRVATTQHGKGAGVGVGLGEGSCPGSMVCGRPVT